MIPSITISAPGSKFSPIVLQGEYASQIRLAASIGFKAVELHICDPNKVDRQAITKAVESSNLVVSTIGTGQAYVDEHIYFTSPVSEVRRAAVQRIKDQIDFAKDFGAKVIIGTIKGPLPADEDSQNLARKTAIDCFRECAEYAERSKVRLTLEAINRYETNFLNDASQTVEFIRQVGSPVVGLHLDTFHMNIEEISIEETIHRNRDHLIHLHVADSNRWSPGRGHVDFLSIMRCLRAVDYQGFLGVECLPLPEPSAAAENALTYLEHLIRLA